MWILKNVCGERLCYWCIHFINPSVLVRTAKEQSPQSTLVSEGGEGFQFVPPLDCTAKHMKEMSTTCLRLPKSFFLFSHCLFLTLCPFLFSSSHPLSRVNEWEVAMLEVYNDSVLQKHKGPSCELMPHHFRQTALNKGPALHSPRLTKRSAVKPWMQLKNRRERGWC